MKSITRKQFIENLISDLTYTPEGYNLIDKINHAIRKIYHSLDYKEIQLFDIAISYYLTEELSLIVQYDFSEDMETAYTYSNIHYSGILYDMIETEIHNESIREKDLIKMLIYNEEEQTIDEILTLIYSRYYGDIHIDDY